MVKKVCEFEDKYEIFNNSRELQLCRYDLTDQQHCK